MADDAISIYDEIEIEDMTYDPTLQIYHYPCPCGDRFEIAIDDLRDGEDIGVCPSCSLMIRVIYDVVSRCSYLRYLNNLLTYSCSRAISPTTTVKVPRRVSPSKRKRKPHRSYL